MSQPEMSYPRCRSLGCHYLDVESVMSFPQCRSLKCRYLNVIPVMSLLECCGPDVASWMSRPELSYPGGRCLRRRLLDVDTMMSFPGCRSLDAASWMSLPGCRDLSCHTLGVDACERWSLDAFQSIRMGVAQLRSHSSTYHLIECVHNCALLVSLVHEMLKL